MNIPSVRVGDPACRDFSLTGIASRGEIFVRRRNGTRGSHERHRERRHTVSNSHETALAALHRMEVASRELHRRPADPPSEPEPEQPTPEQAFLSQIRGRQTWQTAPLADF